jgi:putative alpha-1,2-mannosidase
MKTYVWFFIIILACACFDLSAQKRAKEPVDYVDPLMGTSFPQWTLFPGVTTPSGMVKISPDNQVNGWEAGYDYKTENIAGFSHIHSRTMGGLLVMPITGELKVVSGSPEDQDAGYRSRISHNNEIASPGYYSVILDDYNIKVELTSTARTAFQRYTYPKSDSARILIDLKIPTDNGYEILEASISRVSDTEIEGFSVQQSLLGAEYNKYTLHFVMRFSKPFDSFNGWIGDEILRNTKEVHLLFDDEDLGVFLNFRTDEGDEILVQSGISLVSIDQARFNLDTELNSFNWSFDSVKEEGRKEWNDLLRSIIVKGGSEADLKEILHKYVSGIRRSDCVERC